MATASRPASTGKFEIESADDFVLTKTTSISSATFIGLLSGGATLADVGDVRVEIYHVFPIDSDTTRTPNVPTRVNSPSDNALDDRDNLTFSATERAGFTAANSVQPGGIHPKPGQTTNGNGPITGDEVQFNVTFTTPFVLSAGHYFFVPQVEVTNLADDFFWLSAARPIVPLVRRSRPASPTCRSGRAMRRLTPTGCASARTSWAARPDHPAIQRGVLTSGLRGSRAFDLGHDAARLRGSRLRGLSSRQKGPPRERMSFSKSNSPGVSLVISSSSFRSSTLIAMRIMASPLRTRPDRRRLAPLPAAG